MTVEELKISLEKIVSELIASGFDNINPCHAEKLDELTAEAGKLSMKEGKRLIENLAGVMKSEKEGESKIKSCNVRLMALDFYLKKLSSSANNIEDQ